MGMKATAEERRPLLFSSYLGGVSLLPILIEPNRRILDSNVWRGIPSFAAAPEGPDIRP